MSKWLTLACACQGRGHLKENIPCQDKTYSLSRNGVSAVALCDGAGSARCAEQGAAVAAQAVCEAVCAGFQQYIHSAEARSVKEDILLQVREALQQEADKLGCELKDLACTLLCAAVTQEDFLLLHIGDGVLGYCRAGQLKTASKPVNGEYLNTTVFVTSPEALSDMRLYKGKVQDFTAFVLMSDGPEACLYDRRSGTLAQGLLRICDLTQLIAARHVQKLLQESLETVVRSRTADDCSIIWLIREQDRFAAGFRQAAPADKAALLQLPADRQEELLPVYEAVLEALDKARTAGEIASRLQSSRKARVQVPEDFDLQECLNTLASSYLIRLNQGKYSRLIRM